MRISISVSKPTIDDVVVLHSAQRYITWVALENCMEYFGSVQCIGSNTEPIIPQGQHLLVFRRFLNAIESLNNIPDYIFHEENPGNICLDDFRSKMIEGNTVIRKVSEIANAYKHRIRGSGKKKPFQPKTELLSAKEIKYDHATIYEAFKYWSEYDPKKKNAF